MFARRLGPVLVAALACLAGPAAIASGNGTATPVPSTPTTAAAYVGHPATADPISGVPKIPHNPHLAANGDSGIHNDGWQTNVYARSGPLGVNPQTLSSSINGVCGSIGFDRRGRILSTCVGVSRALYLIDPTTLDVIDSYPLPSPPRDPTSGANPFQNFSGGAYFYVDNHHRAVIGTADGHVLIIKPRGDSLKLVRDLDVSASLQAGEILNSGLPGTDGTLWFVTKKDGDVGTLNLHTGAVHLVRLGSGSDGEIENSIAVGSHGEAYVATNRRLYRFSHGRLGKPQVDWSVAYPNSGQSKPGQVDDGTGTTPAVLPHGYVAITDNADPMDVVVYRTAVHPRHRRSVCTVPVFGKGGSDTENSLIAAGHSLIVENNYGYTGPTTVAAGQSSVPGFARVDINRHGHGCRLVWTNHTESAPSVVPKLSLATGLVYTYTKPAGDVTDPWYWTALDYRTGAVVWKVLAGAGPAYNNNYAGLALSPTGTAYLGVLPGIISLRDGG